MNQDDQDYRRPPVKEDKGILYWLRRTWWLVFPAMFILRMIGIF